VTISDATSGATIYYTTNGTTPTSSSTQYTGAISVSSTETIEAIAVAAGYFQSTLASASYTISLPTSGFIVSGTAVTLSTPGATTGNTSIITVTPHLEFRLDQPCEHYQHDSGNSHSHHYNYGGFQRENYFSQAPRGSLVCGR
jgi:predicted ATP-dependent Lon-type protease